MWRYCWLLIALVAFVCPAAIAGMVSWSMPATYTDNTTIEPADQARIIVTVYTAPDLSAEGTVFAVGAPGETSASGATVRGTYYFATATLDGMTSSPSPRLLFPLIGSAIDGGAGFGFTIY